MHSPIRWLVLMALPLLAACSETDPKRAACLAGLWQSESGEPAAFNAREDGTLRVTTFTGRVWTLALNEGRWRGGRGQDVERRDAALNDTACAAGRVDLTHGGGRIAWTRTAIGERKVRFTANGEAFAGKLVANTAQPTTAMVVLLHGGEKRSAIASNPLQYFLPSKGIAVFVFDKRGTGDSGGDYTQDFALLARDANAALSTARRELAQTGVRTGFLGGSQGAWIANLAAALARDGEKPDFLIAAYGLAQSPLDEDREEVFDDLRRKGFGDAPTLAKAREITDATAAVMRSNFTQGLDQMDAVSQQYSEEPWYGAIEGEFTGDFLSMPSWLLGWIGPLIGDNTTWTYDPLPHIRAYTKPALWVLAGEDTEAPSATTLALLRQLQDDGARNLDIARFPNAEHAMIMFEKKGKERIPVGIAPGYFEFLADWIANGRVTNLPGVEIYPANPSQSTPPPAVP